MFKYKWLIAFATIIAAPCFLLIPNKSIKLDFLLLKLNRGKARSLDLTLKIDDTKKVFINRVCYIERGGEIDSTNSGEFENQLSNEKYNQIEKLLETAHIDALPTFSDIDNCDDCATSSLIVYYNGKRKAFKATPYLLEPLIDSLKKIGKDKNAKNIKKFDEYFRYNSNIDDLEISNTKN